MYVSLLGKHGISAIVSVIPMRRTEPILNTNVIFLLLFVGGRGHAVFVYACKAASVARLATFLRNPITFQIILLFSHKQLATSLVTLSGVVGRFWYLGDSDVSFCAYCPQ